MITIVDYGVGNLGSIRNMLKKIGEPGRISNSISDIENASKLILPGVGAFDFCIDMFNKSGLLNIITNKVFEKKTPILGICVGMQMLTRRSEEGRLPGLAWIQGETIRFRFSNENKKFRVPHMGWNQVFPAKESALTQDFFTESRFYFVHSYLVKCDDRNDILLETEYGSRFTSAIEHKNIFGVQFHPEKSHKFGMKLLKNFCKLD